MSTLSSVSEGTAKKSTSNEQPSENCSDNSNNNSANNNNHNNNNNNNNNTNINNGSANQRRERPVMSDVRVVGRGGHRHSHACSNPASDGSPRSVTGQQRLPLPVSQGSLLPSSGGQPCSFPSGGPAAKAEDPDQDRKPSVRSLSLLLSFALVTITATVVAALSVASSDQAVNAYRESSDEMVGLCRTAGTSSVEDVMSLYVDNVIRKVLSHIHGFLNRPERALSQLHTFLSSVSPDVATDPAWIDQSLRPYLSALHKTVQTNQLRFFPLDYSKAFPPPNNGSRGGVIVYSFADWQLGYNGAEFIQLVVETRSNSKLGHNSTHMHLGSADSMGYLAKAADGGCHLGEVIDFEAGEIIGDCQFPTVAITDPYWVNLTTRALFNFEAGEETPLAEADRIHYSPVLGANHVMTLNVFIPWTHPDMYNTNPRQGNRVGFIMVAITTSDIYDVLSDLHLPGDEGESILYVVQHDPWLDIVGGVVASSTGERTTTTTVSGRVLPALYHVEDYPEPLVARHGHHVLRAYAGQYAGAANDSSGYKLWNFNETTYWWETQTLQRDMGLKWYVTLVIPSSSVMESITSSMQSIVRHNSDAKINADDRKYKSFIILVVAIVVIISILLALSLVFTSLIVRPLAVLQIDMTHVATLHLEEVDMNRPVSRLAEVKSMQLSFAWMVYRLKEVRNYMPLSVFVDEKDTAEDVPESTKTRSSFISSSSANASLRNFVNAVEKEDWKLVDGLRKKDVSVIMFNVLNWHHIIAVKGADSVVHVHAEIVRKMMSAVERYKGLADLFLGDRMTASFNTARMCPNNHRLQSASAAMLAAEDVKNLATVNAQLSFSVVSGDAQVGNIGCKGMRKYTVFSPIMPWAAALERLCKEVGAVGLVDPWIFRDTKHKFGVRCVGRVVYEKRMARPMPIYEMRNTEQVVVELSWMHDTSRDDGQFAVWNKVWEEVFAENWPQAATLMQSISQVAEKDKVHEALVATIARKSYTDLTTISLDSL